MGIIARQTIKGTIWSYLGVIIGFITTAYLFPNYLTPEVVGLFGLLVSLSTLMGQLSLLGLPGVTNRLFTYFRDKENGHNGFLTIALLFHVAGIAIFLGAYFALKPWLIETNIEDSPLFTQYMYLLVPMTLAVMLFTFLDVFNKVLYNAVFGTFLQEFFQRFLILGVTLLYVFKIIDLEQLIIGYAVAVSVKALIIVFFLIKQKAIQFKWPEKTIVNKEMRKEIVNVALYSLIGGLGSMIVFQLDKVIINQMLDLSNTGVYTIAFYFGSLVVMPSRSLLKISGTLIADAWKKNDLKTIKEIYYKSCINQLIIGGFLFLGIWANIDNILFILGDDYAGAKWVIFFIGLGYLIDMSTGANGQVILFSKYYRIMPYLVIILIVTEVVLLYYFIPIWGIAGAAATIFISFFTNNLIRYLFLYRRYKMQPFDYNFLIVISFNVMLYLIISVIPYQDLIIDIIVRSGIIVAFTIIFYRLVPISDEIFQIIKKVIR